MRAADFSRMSGSVLRAVPRLLHHTLRSRVVRLLDLFGILAIKVALLAECWGARAALLLGAQGMSHIGAPIPTTLTTTANAWPATASARDLRVG